MGLLEDIRELDLFGQMITAQPEGLVIVSDSAAQPLIEQELRLAADARQGMLPLVTTPADAPALASASMIVVASLDAEAALHREVVAAAPGGTRVLRLWRDLYVNNVANLSATGRPGAAELFREMPPVDNAELAALRCYAVVCTPRSGSTMLVDMMRQLGSCGTPREHLRHGVLSLVEHTDFDFQHWMHAVLANGATSNGVFGTKIISNFLSRAEKLHRRGHNVLPPAALAPRVIRLRRRDRVAQALSQYVAMESRVFFERDQAKREQRARFLAGLEYDFDALNYVYQTALNTEGRVDSILEGFSGPRMGLDYEDLLENPTAELTRVLEFLDLEVPKGFVAPQPTTAKLDDSKILALHERFSRDLADRKRPSRPKSAPTPGPYQAADEDIVDYQYLRLPGVPFRWRGPAPQSFEAGRYFCTLGAGQTLGRFCSRPFATLVSRSVEIPVLNLGYSGAGPRFYLDHRPIFGLVNSAAFAIVQVMSGRSEGNSLMRCDSGRNLVTWLPTGEECFTEQAFRYLLEDYDHQTVNRVVAETRANWLGHMIQLLDAIAVPTILLWISEREPKYEPQLGGKLYELLGAFPHLVDDEMMEELSPHADATVMAVSSRGVPHKLVSRTTGLPTTVRYPNGEYRGEDRSYPSPEMHEDAAAALLPVVRQMVS